jgi:anti-sigma B factor antagonist
MELKIEQLGRINVVHFFGEVDGISAPQMQEHLLPLVKSGNPLLLELTRVVFMSSSGLRILLGLRRQLSKQGGLVLVGLSQQIRETMSVTGLEDFFTICPTMEEGIAAVGGGWPEPLK